MSHRIYCFSLYCEGHGQVKSQAFVTIRKDEKQARFYADRKNKSDFPQSQGWHSHQMSMIVIPKDVILELAREYAGEGDEDEHNCGSK